ncbi:hypothetical protein IX39_06760 [Chryseobacterium formosense]|uniref:EpsG family protein n=1 Tax=Chryseobacterium formosense TaxID=236814 RepID=A0A085Z7D8_9FLAO|nr:EpsG family protein [Chryseobacterium formosense]KFF00352.1 hypothetical protein IX39_06760 [Chryseobacterium formosense]SFT33133.1 EpsG family protein [Chryseobacterium formosense]
MLFILFLIIVYFISIFLDIRKEMRFLNFIIAFFLLVILIGFVTYTPDYESYKFWLESGNIPDQIEIGYKFLNNLAFNNNIKMIDFQLLYAVATSLLLLLFVSKFSNKNIVLIMIIYLFYIFLFYTTQLRFFLGFFIFIVGAYYLYVENKKIGILLVLISALFHSGIILLMLVFLFLFFPSQLKKIKYYFIFSVLFTFLVLFNPLITVLTSRFGVYSSQEGRSSILGGLIVFLPFLLYFYLIYKLHLINIKNNPLLKLDKKYNFLLVFILTNFLFFPISLYIQIVGHRIIIPGIIMQILFFYYSLSHQKTNKNKKVFLHFIFIVVFLSNLIYSLYLLPAILGSSEINDVIHQILLSNKFIYNTL